MSGSEERVAAESGRCRPDLNRNTASPFSTRTKPLVVTSRFTEFPRAGCHPSWSSGVGTCVGTAATATLSTTTAVSWKGRPFGLHLHVALDLPYTVRSW
jgi:hypothetical protein